jgi:hypothetical protein
MQDNPTITSGGRNESASLGENTAAVSKGENDKPYDADRFLSEIAMELGKKYSIVRDESFHWLTPFGSDHARHAKHAHHGLRRLPELIPGLEPSPPEGGWPAILFANTDDQLAYESLFGGSGTSIINGGCWRSYPVGHLAIPVSEWDGLDAAFGHELVHAILHGGGVPLWLQEGIATELETCMGNRKAPLSDMYHWGKTLTYWRTHSIDLFWSSRAFHDPESSDAAYGLAQVLGYHWTKYPERLREARALGKDGWKDQDAALRKLVGTDRAGLIAAVLGPGRKRGVIERFLYWCFVGDGL